MTSKILLVMKMIIQRSTKNNSSDTTQKQIGQRIISYFVTESLTLAKEQKLQTQTRFKNNQI
jgi:hypothetical protein